MIQIPETLKKRTIWCPGFKTTKPFQIQVLDIIWKLGDLSDFRTQFVIWTISKQDISDHPEFVSPMYVTGFSSTSYYSSPNWSQ